MKQKYFQLPEQSLATKCNASSFEHTKFTYSLKCTSRYFPNRDELSLRTVLALPKLSSRGDASSICSVIRLEGDLFTAAKYCITSFVDSVFPEPLSPEITTTWLSGDEPSFDMWPYAEDPIAKRCL